MTDADQVQFADLLGAVYAYYRRDLSPLVVDLWWNGCSAYELAQVSAVLSAHLQDPDRGQFLPLVADVNRALRGTSTDRAALAWGKVREAMSDVGAYCDVVFDDPAIHCAVADLGGWPKLCRVPAEELGYEQHRFAQSYRAYSKALPETYPRALMGDRGADEEFARKGMRPPLRAVGDRQRARLVYEGRAVPAQIAAQQPRLEHQP